MRIAIVGCGISGANTLKTIIDHKNYSEDIYLDVFEKREELAVGIAYEDDDIHKLLNTDIEHMNIGADKTGDFKNWLEENYDDIPFIESKIPRSIFGNYAKEKFQPYFDHKNVNVHKKLVNDLIKEKDGYYIKSEYESYGPYQVVFLSIGQSYYKDDYNLESFSNYSVNPYPIKKKIKNISKDDKIGIIGTGPSSVDIYRYLSRYFEFESPLYFFTHKSFFAMPEIDIDTQANICSIDEAWIRENKDSHGLIKLSDFEETFYSDFKKISVDFDQTYLYYKDNNPSISKHALINKDRNLALCQAYTTKLWYVVNDLYNSFYGVDRKIFREKYLKRIVHLMTKTPAPDRKSVV